jgi:hypothetical protein
MGLKKRMIIPPAHGRLVFPIAAPGVFSKINAESRNIINAQYSAIKKNGTQPDGGYPVRLFLILSNNSLPAG